MAESKSTATARTGIESLRDRAATVDPIVLAAGAAVAGAVAGALVPRSDTETQFLAPIGKHLHEATGSLGTAVRQTLSAELAGVPVVGPIAVQQIDHVIDSVVQSVAAEPEADCEDAETNPQVDAD